MMIRRKEVEPVEREYTITLTNREAKILSTMLGRYGSGDYIKAGFTSEEAERGYQMYDMLDDAASGNI